MKPDYWKNLSAEEQDWISAYLNGAIGPESFEALQDRMVSSPELRATIRRCLAIDDSLREFAEDSLAASSGNSVASWTSGEPKTVAFPTSKVSKGRRIFPIAIAAGLAFLLGLAFMFVAFRPNVSPAIAATDEPSAEGFAVLTRLFDAEWTTNEVRHEGDTLGAEMFQLASGTAEIQFFSGATMTVEGPSQISLKSAWEASCLEGAVRMQVPPAARGFKLHAPSSEIIDLGTEFGLVVREDKSHVEVIDGEIALRHRDEKETILEKGDALGLPLEGPSEKVAKGQVSFPDANRFGSRAIKQKQDDFERWKSHRNSLAKDERLIAYYTFDQDSSQPLVPNLAIPRNPKLDGATILAGRVDGRWAGMKQALEFRRPGSRVRVNLPGEFSAFTFVTWVRIDSLDRWYNALFMADSYETGEPHWQIREDGSMMVSVMVDDSRTNPKNPDGPPIRFQRLYFSPPMWEPSMSGQWLNLASVFDPENKRVSHYVNGERISREAIKPEHHIDQLRIGNAEIGNWGQPFREDPVFAIRNLNGRMDEIAIFNAALQDKEIASLYERSRTSR